MLLYNKLHKIIFSSYHLFLSYLVEAKLVQVPVEEAVLVRFQLLDVLLLLVLKKDIEF